MTPLNLLIVTGYSGAGRHSVLGALEDAGWVTLDNVPVLLMEPLLDLRAKLGQEAHPNLAVGMDLRDDSFATQAEPLLDRLQARENLQCYLLFVEADETTLLRRFSETRRPHPLAGDGSVGAAITQERELLESLRIRARFLLDTSCLNLSDMRLRIGEMLASLSTGELPPLHLRLLSFGFKYGLPPEADVILDARFLPNPYYERGLRNLTGQEEPVQEFLMNQASVRDFLDRAEAWLTWSVPMIQKEGRAYHTVGIGCTGGRHRSVFIVEALAERLRQVAKKISVQHRQLN